MKCLQFILVILVGLGSLKPCRAQTGLLGRNIVVKANPTSFILDNGIDVEVEVAAFRYVTFSLHYFSSRREQSWGDKIYAAVDGRHLGIKYRIYIPSAILAPKGWYMSFNAYGGKIKAAGDYNNSNNGLDDFELTNTVITIENSIGKQVFIKKRVVLDWHIGLSHTTMPANKTHGTELNQIGRTYTSKLALVNFNSAFGNDPYEGSYLEGSPEGATCLYGGIKVGFIF